MTFLADLANGGRDRYKAAMRSILRKFSVLSVAAIALACGCQASMRVAHLMVQGEGIKHDVDQFGSRDSLIRAADGEAAKYRVVR